MKTIKKIIIISSILATATSCSDINEPIIEVKKSEMPVSIVRLDSKTWITDVPYADQCSMDGKVIKVQSNIPVISAVGERYSGNHGFSFGRDDNNEFVFFWGKNEGYTVDCGFSLVQSMWESEWIDYVNYGFIETALNFRVRGALGTNYLDLTDPDNYTDGKNYYLKGKVVGISAVSSGTESFELLDTYSSFFKKIGYVPVTSYAAEYVTFTIETDEGSVDITAYGKQRDNEIGSLLDYVNIDSVIEVPAKLNSNISVAKEEIRQRKFHQILCCEVFCEK